MYMPNSAAAAVGLERKARAGVITPISACASGSEGIANAWRNIVLGEADIAICGGVETTDRGGADRRIRPDANRVVHHQR